MRAMTTQIGVRVQVLPPDAPTRLEVHLPSSSMSRPLEVPLGAAERAEIAAALTARQEAMVGPLILRHFRDAPPEVAEVAVVLDVTAGPERSRSVRLTAQEASDLAALLNAPAHP